MTHKPREVSEDRWILEAVQTYQSQLIAYAFSILGDRELGREVVQDAFLKLCEQRKAEVEQKLQAWLYRVVRNRSLNLKRKDKRMIHGMESRQLETLASKVPPIKGGGVFELIQTLPEKQSELLMLKFSDGLSYREISEVTGLSSSNVGYILHHALKALKDLWEEVENGK